MVIGAKSAGRHHEPDRCVQWPTIPRSASLWSCHSWCKFPPMSRDDDAVRSALQRLRLAVLVLERGSLRPYNPIGNELFEREGLSADLLKLRPSHPLSELLAKVLEHKRDVTLPETVVTFPSGARYRIEPSQRSEKGRDRMIMLLIEPVKAVEEKLSLAALHLTAREEEVARLMLQGLSAEAMSNALEISVETLRTHVRSILAKSGTKTRLEFVARVLGEGQRSA